MGLGEQTVGLVVDDLHRRIFDIRRIIVGLDGGGSSEHHLIILHIGAHGLDHGRQIVLDLLFAAACQQGDHGARRRGWCRMVCEILAHLIGRGVTHVMDGVMVLLLEEIDLEGQNREELVDIAADVLDAVLLPRPYLRRDIVVDGYVCP